MGKNAYFVSHKKSKLKENGGPKLPLAADLVEGEIAINFGKDVETLSIKNESGDVVTFSSDNYYTEKKLGSGFTSSNSAKTVTEALTALSGTVTGHTSNANIHLTTTEKTNIDSLATNIKAISGITSTKVSSWDNAASNSHSHTNKSVIDTITQGDIDNWNSKASASGTVTSVQIGLPTGLSASTTAITTSGKFDIKYSNGYSIPTTTKQNQWDTAYTNNHTHSNKTALDSITGSVGTMAYQATTSYSSATQVSTALDNKVDKVTGKGLSTNDYTTDEKNKLSGIASGAQVNVIETVKVNGTALTPSSKAVNVTVPTKTSDLTNDSNFVSDASYVHTDNNYTTTEKSKLSGIASGAEVNQNAFSNIKVGTTTVAADGKTDTLEISGSGIVTITADATNDKITISASNAVTSVAGKTGAVTLAKGDVGLGNVDNTADATKTVKAATSAQTADTAKAVALSGVTNADDLKAIEAIASTSGLLKKTAANTWTLDTNSYSTTAVAVTGATYNTTNKTIDLKNAAGTVVSTVDATAFIKDGMVSNVEVKDVASSGTCLVITFNTDAGKDAINIPISQIFDASNYYTKADLTGSSTTVVVAKASSATTAASAGSVALSNVTGADDLKAIEGLTGTSGLLKKTAANTWTLDTTDYSNKNAFGKIKINAESTTIDSDTTNDTLTISGGSFVTLTSDATNDKFTIGVSTGTSSSTLARGDHNHDSAYQAKGSYLTGTTKYAGSSTQGGAATSAEKLSNTSAIGSVTNPVFFTANGVPSACTYSLNKTVPSNAVFTDTDTKVTAVGNHYTPSATSADTKSATASSTSELNWGSAVVTGVTLSGDAKGHITSVTLASGKLKTPSKSDVGLGNVENKSSATIRGEITSSNVTTALGYTPVSSVTSSSTNGNISVNGGNVLAYTHPTTSGNKHIPSGGSSGQFLGWDSDGTAKWVSNPNSDTKVGQSSAATNGSFPIIIKNSNNNTAETAATKFATGVTINPSSNTITATNFVGKVNGITPTNNTGTVTSVAAGGGLSGGTITTSGTIGLAATGTAGTYGPAADVTGTEGTTIKIPQITTDAYGRVTSVTERTLTNKNSTYTVNNGTFTVSGNGASVASTSANASANTGVNIKAGSNVTITTGTSEITIAASQPTVNNGTLNLQANGTTKTSFTANQSATSTFNITSGSTNGTIAVGGADVAVKGLGSMAYTNTGSYSSATQVNTALAGKSNTGHTHDGTYAKSTFSRVTVGSTNIDADTTGDTLTLSGSNVTLTPDATNDKLTIGITKSNVTTALGYTPPTSDTNYYATGLTVATAATTNTLTISGTNSAVKGSGVISAATTTAAGLMSAADRTKLNGIAAGAEVNVQSDWNATSGDAFIKNKPYIPTIHTNGGLFVNVVSGQMITQMDVYYNNQDHLSELTFIPGSNITLTPDAANKKITIAATDTTYTAATAAPGKVASASAKGSSTNYARQDHTHGIDLATGDSNGQVKIAGTNVSVKGLKSAAYMGANEFPIMSFDETTQLTSGGTCDLSAVGTYHTTSKAISASLTNPPFTESNFRLWHFSTGLANYPAQLAISFRDGMAMRGKNNTEWYDWKYFAFKDDNVASATKLNTARNIWGQSFDGTADISGDITVGNGNVILNNHKHILSKDKNGDNRGILRITNGNILQIGAGLYELEDSATNIYAGSSGLGFHVGSTGKRMFINSLGNVGIGTTSPSHKLSVSGDVSATSFIKEGGTSSQFLKADGSVDSNSYALTTLATTTSNGLMSAADKTALGYITPVQRTIYNGTNTARWTILASAPSNTTSRYSYLSILVSGLGYYYGAQKCGTYLVEMQTSNTSVPSMQVTTLSSRGSTGNVKFGYYIDSEAGKIYFGVYTSTRHNNIQASTIYKASANIALLDTTTVLTEAPAGWTEVDTMPSPGLMTGTVAVTGNVSSSCGITGTGRDGMMQTIIYTNATTSDYVVTVPTTYKTPTGAALELTCPAGGYCEVSYMNINGTIYARGA